MEIGEPSPAALTITPRTTSAPTRMPASIRRARIRPPIVAGSPVTAEPGGLGEGGPAGTGAPIVGSGPEVIASIPLSNVLWNDGRRVSALLRLSWITPPRH